jgi:hypothetical protein
MSRTVSLPAYLALWVFALALALIEAAVVIYLRALSGSALFPLQDMLKAIGPQLHNLEVCREVATLLVLFVPAYLLQAPPTLRVVAYVLLFALWDLAYYGFLSLFLGWPNTLMTYDVLFLIPQPWIAPVLCPILVASTLALGTTAYLYLARNRAARTPSIGQGLGLFVGAVVMLVAFMWETGYYLKGGMPPRFAWWAFIPGYGLMLLAGAHLLFQFSRQDKARFF